MYDSDVKDACSFTGTEEILVYYQHENQSNGESVAVDFVSVDNSNRKILIYADSDSKVVVQNSENPSEICNLSQDTTQSCKLTLLVALRGPDDRYDFHI